MRQRIYGTYVAICTLRRHQQLPLLSPSSLRCKGHFPIQHNSSIEQKYLEQSKQKHRVLHTFSQYHTPKPLTSMDILQEWFVQCCHSSQQTLGRFLNNILFFWLDVNNDWPPVTWVELSLFDVLCRLNSVTFVCADKWFCLWDWHLSLVDLCQSLEFFVCAIHLSSSFVVIFL